MALVFATFACWLFALAEGFAPLALNPCLPARMAGSARTGRVALHLRIEARSKSIKGDGEFRSGVGDSVQIQRIGTCETATREYMNKMGATYSVLWRLEADNKFHVQEDFTTEERRQAWKKVRKDNKTFAAESRNFTPRLDGKGPIATAWRTGQEVIFTDAGSMLRQRKTLAQEFGIKKILFKPVPGGVLEVGTPSDESLLYRDLLRISFEQLYLSSSKSRRNILMDIVFVARLSVVAAASTSSASQMQGLRLFMSDMYSQGLAIRREMVAEFSARPLKRIGKFVPLFFLTVAMSLVTPILYMTTLSETYYSLRIKRQLDEKPEEGTETLPGRVLAVRVFKKLDVDSDGVLTAEEWDRAFGRQSNLYPPLRSFQDFTSSKDFITLQEFVDVAGESMMSERIARAVGL